MESRDENTDESEEKPFTFPQCNSLYSRIRQSARAPSQRKPLRRLRRIPMPENFITDQESRSDSQQNTKKSDSDSQSYDPLFEEVIPHKTESSWNTTTEGVNDDKFYFPEHNRKNLNEVTPLPLKLCTPFSSKSSLLVKRVLKADFYGEIGVHGVKDSRQVPVLSKQFSNENRGRSNEKQDALIYSECMSDNKRNERVLKDILNYDRNHFDQCKGQAKNCLETIKEIRDTNSGNSDSKEKLFEQPLACNIDFKYSTGGLQSIKGNSSIPEKQKSQQSTFKERENLKEVVVHDTRLSNEVNSVLSVNNIEYTVISILGRGGSSKVYQVLNRRTSSVLAMKCVNLRDADSVTAEGYLKEIKMLSKLQDSNRIIKLIDHEYLKLKQILYIVMEKGEIDFATFLRQMIKTGDNSIPMVIYYWTEMLYAVKEIHTNGIVHADLKPANFLFVRCRLKLIDFGIASAMQNDATSVFKSSMHGTCNYMSPEAIDAGDPAGVKVGYKSDVWSLGCILYNMLYGRTPFQHITKNVIKLQTIANPSHKIEFPPIAGCPPVLLETLKRCLTYDYKKRPTVPELLAVKYY